MRPLRPKIFSISCSFSENLTKLYVGAPPRGLVPPPTGNPGSAPEYFSLMGGLHLPHWKAEDLAFYYLYSNVLSHNSVYQMYLTERFTGRCTSERWRNGRITQTHLLKLNSRVPRMSLGSSFKRDLLYMAAWLPKKARGYGLHGFLDQMNSD